MKRAIMLILVVVMSFTAYAKDRIELVESIPVETTLDNEDIRNTPEVWLEMINGAKRTLDFGEFYISHKEGEALTPILDAITKAADRGVKVRFVIDGNMYKTYPETADQLNEHKNIDVRVYDLSEITGGVLHAKYFIVDDKEIFIGSQNMDWRALKHIHELGIRIENKGLISFYKELFDLDWALAAEDADSDGLLRNIVLSKDLKTYSLQKTSFGKVGIIPTASNPEIIYHTKNWDEIQLVHMINDAKDKIKIQLLSYSPYSRGEYFTILDVALRKAAARGVKVEMILSDWNLYSPRIDYIKSLHAIPNIEIKFSTIPEASEGYIGYARVEHCKYMIVDDKEFWLGTSNWSKSYFHNGRNLGLIVQNNMLAERVSAIFDKSWDSPYCALVDLGKTYERKKDRRMNFLNSIPVAVFETIGTVAGLAACTVLLIQIIKEYKSNEKSSLSMPFIVGWIFIYLFWEIYGLRFNAIAMYVTNAIAIVLQVLLLVIVLRKNSRIKMKKRIEE